MIANSNSKQAIANRRTKITRWFVPLLELITSLFGISIISSNITATSSARLIMHVKSFRYLTMSKSLSPSQAHVLGFQT